MMYLVLPAGAAVLAAGAVVAMVAPPALLLAAVYADTASIPPLFRENHIDVYLTAGPAFTVDIDGDAPWTHSQSVEALWDGTYAEVRLEHFHMPHHVQYVTARAGRFFHPKPIVSGGVTIGYRAARGVRGQSGIELGLPLIAGGREGWYRIETTYVRSRDVTNWNLRMQGLYPIPKRRLFAGVTFEMKSLPFPVREEGQYVSTASALIGFRY